MSAFDSRRSTALILLNFVVLIALIYAVAARILLSGFHKVEMANAMTNGERLQSTLDNAVTSLDATALAWAQWDQAAKFVEHQDSAFNRQFLEGELNTESLSAVKSDAAAYLDARGHILFAEGVDFRRGTARPFPAALRAQLQPASALLKLPRADSFVRGLVQLPEGVMMVAVRPVINSSGTGPVKGAFLLARFLDNDIVKQLSAQLQLPLSMQPFSARLSADFATARDSLKRHGSSKVFRVSLSNQTNAIYLCSPDIYGQPALLSRMETPRYVFQQGLASLRALLLALLIIGAIAGSVLWLTQRSLGRARHEQRQRDELYRSLTLNSSDVLFTVDFPEQTMQWFGNTQQFFGAQPLQEQDLSACLEQLHPDDRADCAAKLRDRDPRGFSSEYRLLRDGEISYVLLRGKALNTAQDGEEDGTFRVVGAAIDITERRKSELEKEVLLKEIHHRVKNNMQVISSMLNLQASYLPDPALRATFQDSQNRIKSMALIHERLYGQNDLARLDFTGYLEQLTRTLVRTYRTGDAELKLNLAEVEIDIDRAVPCGLIVNELVSNALKHAFPHGSGTLEVKLFKQGENAVLYVQDDGIGFPEAIDFRNTDSLGLQLVDDFSAQIGGEVRLERTHPGTRWTVTFPQKKASAAQPLAV